MDILELVASFGGDAKSGLDLGGVLWANIVVKKVVVEVGDDLALIVDLGLTEVFVEILGELSGPESGLVAYILILW